MTLIGQGRVTLVERVAYSRLENLFFTELRDLDRRELRYVATSQVSQEDADEIARHYAREERRMGRKVLWLEDTRKVDGMPSRNED